MPSEPSFSCDACKKTVGIVSEAAKGILARLGSLIFNGLLSVGLAATRYETEEAAASAAVAIGCMFIPIVGLWDLLTLAAAL